MREERVCCLRARDWQLIQAARAEARRLGFRIGRRVQWVGNTDPNRVGRITGWNNSDPLDRSRDNAIHMPVMVQWPWWHEPIAWSIDCLALVDPEI